MELTWRYAYRPDFVPLLMEYLGARSGMHILDVGCGTGFLARLLAQTLSDVQVARPEADEKILDLLWQFKAAGLQDVQINGHLALVSPGDARIPVAEGAAYALARHQKELDGLIRMRQEHGEELAAAGFSPAEFDEFITLKRARYEYLQGDPARVREVMDVFSEPLLIVRGTRPSPRLTCPPRRGR